MKVCVVIPAAGTGTRMNSAVPKQFLQVAGKPIIQHTIDAFERSGEVEGIILSVPATEMESAKEEWGALSILFQIVAGGAQRQDSVYNGLQAIPAETEIVIVHDGVRPFLDARMIRESISTAKEFGAAIVALPVNDTVKRVDQNCFVQSTVDRDGLWKIQTPQTFRRDILQTAMDKAMSDGFYGTDEGMLLERLGKPVKLILGSEYNIKITHPEDLPLAEMIAASKKIISF